MPQVTLTNLLTYGDFENSGWSGGSYDNSIKKYGNYSLKVTASTGAPETLVQSTVTYPLIQGHTYYARYEFYHQGLNSAVTMGIYWPIAEPNFIESQPTGTANTWNTVSAVSTRSSFGSGSYAMRFDFNNNYTSGTVWMDGAMLIDLTACFGAGNEPTKEECDKIPFFIGTMEYPPLNAKVKINNEWKDVVNIFTKKGGGWSSISDVKFNIGGQWK